MKGVFYRNGSLLERWKGAFHREIGLLQSCKDMRVSFVIKNEREMGVFQSGGREDQNGREGLLIGYVGLYL